MIDLTGKVVLITGGSRGIGAACVKSMVSVGADVVIHYGSNKAAAEAVAQDVGAEHCHLIAADLDITGAAKNLWSEALAWKGHIDVLVNNAGIFRNAPYDATDEEWNDSWRNVLQVNLIASADLCREAVKTWSDKKSGGIIINVASRAAFRGDSTDQWPYAASKGGMISMTRTIARAYAAQGILAYGVAPGFVETDMALNAFAKDPALRPLVVRDIPMGDIAPASDVGNLICFLGSGLSPHSTGTTIDVNGASYVH